MPTREEFKATRRKNQQSQRTIALIITIAGALLIAAVLILPNLLRQSQQRPDTNGTSMGDPNAPVKVEEFSDFQCPYCGLFAQKMEPQFISEYVTTGKVYLTFVPFSFLGPESIRAAEAAYCAQDQGKFWEYHDTLFKNQNGEEQGAFADDRLQAFAVSLGLNATDFNQCFNDGKHRQQVVEDVNYGKSKGVNGTPSFTVNGQLVMAEQLIATIDAALKAQP